MSGEASLTEAIEKSILTSPTEKRFVAGKTPIKLQEVPFGLEEVNEAIDSLMTTQLVMGKKTKIFEDEWSRWVGRPYSVCVNSGSSALLLVMMWLKFHKARQTGRSEILIPAVTWSTSLFPAMIVGLKPVLVDVDLNNLCVNSFAPFITDNTLAVMPVHLMGHACRMDVITEEARKHDLIVIEDCCEAHGTRYKGKKVGTFGDAGVWSFMFSHHITTIEGGMISVDDLDCADTFRMFRAHGWIRDVSGERKAKVIKENPDIHPSFLFADMGINVRPTEITASFGIHQLKRLDDFVELRRKAFKRIGEELSCYSEFIACFSEAENEYLSPFAYPLLVRDRAPFSRKDLRSFLEEHKIETRPIEGSNLSQHPFMRLYPDLVEIRGDLRNAAMVHERGFFFGLNQTTDEEKISYVAEIFRRFFAKL